MSGAENGTSAEREILGIFDGGVVVPAPAWGNGRASRLHRVPPFKLLPGDGG